MEQDKRPSAPPQTREQIESELRARQRLEELRHEAVRALDAVSGTPEHAPRTVAEEWREIVLLAVMLVDRMDRLVERAGVASRRELLEMLLRV